jgi:NitT/TauT family transport system permease protein
MEKNNEKNIVLFQENLPVAFFVCVGLVVWHYGVVLLKVPEYILPTPYAILCEMLSSYDCLVRHAVVTLYEVLCGFFIAAIAAFLFSIGILFSTFIRKIVYPIIIFFQVVPKIAIAPLFLIWFGYGVLPKIIITAIVCFFPILVNAVKGLGSIDNELLELTRSLNASKTQVLLKVRIPSSVPFIFAGLRISITLSVIGAIIGEFIGADKGLGYLIMIANSKLDTTMLFAILVVLSVLGIMLFLIICIVEKAVLGKWHLHPVQTGIGR